MKNIKHLKINYTIKLLFLAMVFFINIKCTRDLSADSQLSKNSNLAEVFTDSPIGMGTNFYFPYAPGPDNAVGSKLDAWTVDQTVSYKGNASMRFDVPTDTDPNGNYAGGIFRIDGAGRDLSGYDALTFWAKASQGVTIAEIGFGEDFFPNKYITTMRNVSIGTNWTKITIPMPDPSKLIFEKGMLRYAANTIETNGKGYIFWIDELKFEKLGTIANPQPSIFNGVNKIEQTFIDSNIQITDLKDTFNMPSGLNQTVSASANYFIFKSSNENIATVNATGLVSIKSSGTCTIKASLAGVEALGSLTLNVAAAFVNAAIPTLPQSSVISIFSDTYSGVTALDPGIFAGAATTNITTQTFGNNSHLTYNTVDFVGIGWNGTVNVSTKTMLHLDIQLKSATGSNLVVELKDFGPNGVNDNYAAGGDTSAGKNISSQLTKDQWVSINIPLNQFTLSTGGGGSGVLNKNNMGYVVFVSTPNGLGASFLVDNIYFY